jgi:hypothetical protein
LEQISGPRGPEFKMHNPVLMFKGENTPYLYGAREIYALVFSEKRACVSAHVTTVYRNEPNPFSAVLAALGSNIDAAAPKPTERTTARPRWYPLSGDRADTGLWLGLIRFAIEENSTVRITLEYSQPKDRNPDDKSQVELPEECLLDPKVNPSAVSSTAASNATASLTPTGVTMIAKIEPSMGATAVLIDPNGATTTARVDPVAATTIAQKDTEYSGDFLSANGFVSNSPGGWATLSFALGASGNVEGTAVASGGSRFTVNGYATAKFYMLRPRINVAPGAWAARRTSLAIFAGTGIKSPFDELVFGLSVGHVIGNAGLLLGGNTIAAPKDSDRGRKFCWFGGIDYSF